MSSISTVRVFLEGMMEKRKLKTNRRQKKLSNQGLLMTFRRYQRNPKKSNSHILKHKFRNLKRKDQLMKSQLNAIQYLLKRLKSQRRKVPRNLRPNQFQFLKMSKLKNLKKKRLRMNQNHNLLKKLKIKAWKRIKFNHKSLWDKDLDHAEWRNSSKLRLKNLHLNQRSFQKIKRKKLKHKREKLKRKPERKKSVLKDRRKKK